jgi:hypothetical protein
MNSAVYFKFVLGGIFTCNPKDIQQYFLTILILFFTFIAGTAEKVDCISRRDQPVVCPCAGAVKGSRARQVRPRPCRRSEPPQVADECRIRVCVPARTAQQHTALAPPRCPSLGSLASKTHKRSTIGGHERRSHRRRCSSSRRRDKSRHLSLSACTRFAAADWGQPGRTAGSIFWTMCRTGTDRLTSLLKKAQVHHVHHVQRLLD